MQVLKKSEWGRGFASVRQLVFILTLAFCAVAFTGGTVVHAMEPVQCGNLSTSIGAHHATGDNDSGQSDAGKADPHHHGGCHGHQLAELRNLGSTAVMPATAAVHIFRVADTIASTEPDLALRPPIA